MPSSPARDGREAGAAGPMPVPVRVAVVLLALLAVLLLLNSALTWFGRDPIADRLVAAQPGLSRAEAERFVVVTLLPYLVIGLTAAASAVGLPRRRPWARWTGLAGAVGLVVVSVLSMLSAGGATAVSLLVLVLGIGAVTSLLARPTGEWLPRLPSPARRRPGR